MVYRSTKWEGTKIDLKKIENYTLDDISVFFKENADAILIVDAKLVIYKAISRKGIFLDLERVYFWI